MDYSFRLPPSIFEYFLPQSNEFEIVRKILTNFLSLLSYQKENFKDGETFQNFSKSEKLNTRMNRFAVILPFQVYQFEMLPFASLFS